MYKVYVGEISPERKEDWFRKDENPYAVWAGKAIASEICTIETIAAGNQLLQDGIDVDWGCRAWRSNKQRILTFFKTHNWNGTPLAVLQEDTDYAVVFIESVWGDSA